MTAKQPASRARRWFSEVAETLVLTVLIFLGIQTFVTQPFEIEQHSMENTLLPGEFVLVDKLTPRWEPYERGDIVVFKRPGRSEGSNTPPLIKRVIGLPGEKVELRDGKVFVDGVALAEPYVHRQGGTVDPTEPQDGSTSWVVPEGTLFVLGDHREVSADSRTFGPVDQDDVVGRAWLRYWPFEAFGPLISAAD